MKIENIKIKNFYSIRNVELDLGKYSGLTIIKGKNKDTKGSNGSGKSALIEAILFGLTGKTIRKSTEDSLVNNKAKRGCSVELQITKDNDCVIIKRCKKPTKLEFFIGDDNLTKATVAQTQAVIDETLNTNYKVLLYSMFFGQSNNISFLDSSADDKRTIIKTFLNLDHIFSMRDRIKGYKSTAYQGMKLQDSLVEEQERTKISIKKKLDTIETSRQIYTDKYDDYTLSLSLDDILDGENNLRDINFKIAALDKELEAIKDRCEDLSFKVEYPNVVELCEMCGQERSGVIDLVETKKTISILLVDQREKERLRANLVTQMWSPPISSNEFSKVLGYKELCRDENTFKDLIKESEGKLSEYHKTKSQQKIIYDVMRFWEKALSEQGVVKYIIKNVLSYFNDRCNFYLSYLASSNYFVEFDDELTEKITTNSTIIQYISLSGGEKRKVNLSVMLALKDLLLLTDKEQSDLVFFDEVAENLDEDGVRGLYELFQEIKKTKTVFVITHNKYLKTLLDSSKRLTIVKHKGITKVLNK